MSHRLGSLLQQSPTVDVGPNIGTQVAPNVWQVVFSPPTAPNGGTKFLLLHLTTAGIPAGARVEVDLGYDTDVFTSASGQSFWTRPAGGNSVTLRYVGSAAATISIVEYGRGEPLLNGGADGANGGNTNADLFLLSSPYTEPTYFNPSGVTPASSQPSWENIACVAPGTMRDAARSVGMFVSVHAGVVSSCTATLVGPDLILTAAHCLSTDAEAASASFTLDYQTNCDGTRPAGYAPRFWKIKRVVVSGAARAAGDTRPVLDYSISQLETGGVSVGAPPLSFRTTIPMVGEELFVVHHPRGVPKKISRQPADPSCKVLSLDATTVTYACDSDNGSSGSPVLDMNKQIVAVNDWVYGAFNNRGQGATAIVQDMATPPAPAKDVDVMLVLDRSGSMSLTGVSGDTKMTEAKRAAALFLDLIRTDRTHRAGVVSFSHTVTLEAALAQATTASVDALIGPAPARNAGVVGAIAAGGSTSIGGGLQTALQQFPAPTATTNAPYVLLMTDGMQNSPPMIAAVEGQIDPRNLSIIGFGGTGDLDGALLTQLASRHRGMYTRAGEGLSLRKFFVLAFGNIFQTGSSFDPFYVIAAGATSAAPVSFGVCGEDTITVILGWEHPANALTLTLTTPNGTQVDATTAGVTSRRGEAWQFLRIPLPLAGQRDGTWIARVSRPGGRGGELDAAGAALPAERFFLSTVVDGGPVMRPPETRHYYTGDAIEPRVSLRWADGERVDATVTVDVEAPGDGAGNILAREGLRPARVVGGETLDARASALLDLEEARGGALIPSQTRTFPLFDDDTHLYHKLEPDGTYMNVLPNLTRHEGHYTFRARAEFGEGCTTSRETSWSAYVSVGIDPGKTRVEVTPIGDGGPGPRTVRLTFTPMDQYGNYLGPGRLGDFTVAGAPGSTLATPISDAGNGSYVVDVVWDPGAAPAPGITISQPDRPPVVVAPGRTALPARSCAMSLLVALVILLAIAVLWLLLR